MLIPAYSLDDRIRIQDLDDVGAAAHTDSTNLRLYDRYKIFDPYWVCLVIIPGQSELRAAARSDDVRTDARYDAPAIISTWRFTRRIWDSTRSYE